MGAVGEWEGFAGGAVTGGCPRGGGVTTGPGREKAPPTRDRRGFIAVSLIRRTFLPVWARAKVLDRKAHNPQEQ